MRGYHVIFGTIYICYVQKSDKRNVKVSVSIRCVWLNLSPPAGQNLQSSSANCVCEFLP